MELINHFVNKRILITGATSGIGKYAAQFLAKSGAEVILFYRSEEKATQLINEFKSQNCTLPTLIQCNLSSIESIKTACNEVLAKFDSLDVLINNAGTWNWALTDSVDGIEEIFAVNVIAPYLITEKLSSLYQKNTKLIFTSSALHFGEINFEDIEYRKSFSGYQAYRQSKLCDIILAKHFADKYKDSEIFAYSFHPGMVNTDLGRTANPLARFAFKAFGISLEKGASTMLYLTEADNTCLDSGAYYANKKVVKTQKYSYNKEIEIQLVNKIQEYLNK